MRSPARHVLADWTSSTENILVQSEDSTTKHEEVKQLEKSKNAAIRRRRLRICLAIILGIIVISGAVVGTLVAKDVIRLGSSKTSTSTPPSAGADTNDQPGPPSDSGAGEGTPTSAGPATTTTAALPPPTICSSAETIPAKARGGWTDLTSWLDMTDFNCTFTSVTIGGLPVAGLNSSWDDSKQANEHVPPLAKPWGGYNNRPIRGVNIGGWLSLEPFITPSLFDFDPSTGIVDEYTLCAHLGPKQARITLEKHYATFITEGDFKAIAAAGLDHVRIPFPYWVVKVFDDDTYVQGVGWRYLLRAIEWARRYGLRVKLDLHAAPGSQNGWNHSGRQGSVGWLSGPNGTLNAQRTLAIHNQLSQFFAQDRYRNVVAFYGQLNEPALALSQDDLITWTRQVYDVVRGNGVDAVQVFSESMRGLGPWAGKLSGYGDNLAIDVHLYTIFDVNLTIMKHAERVAFACHPWADQLTSGSRGFGPTMVGEWSQADSDCGLYVNGVGNGARWSGTFSGNMGQPACPTRDSRCTCNVATADPATYTADFKLFLRTWAAAQMSTMEATSWGWFYWTWKTESAPLWSYSAGLEGGYMPALAYEREWDCSQPIPSFGSLPEYY